MNKILFCTTKVDEGQSIAQTYRIDRGEKITTVETQLLERIFVLESQPATLRDALGLVNLANLYVPEPVTCINPVELNTAAAKSTLLAIDLLGNKFEPGTQEGTSKEKIRSYFPDLKDLAQRKISDLDPVMNVAIEAANLCRDRILEIECQRGDLPTAATNAALVLRSIEGIPTIVKILQNLDNATLVRGYSYGNQSKAAVMSHLMRISCPASNDTPVEFARQVRAAKISEEKLIQFAFFAPQWVNYIQQAIDLPGFAEKFRIAHPHDLLVTQEWHLWQQECFTTARQQPSILRATCRLMKLNNVQIQGCYALITRDRSSYYFLPILRFPLLALFTNHKSSH